MAEATATVTDAILGQDKVKNLIEVAVEKDLPVLLVGDTGTGKTSIIRESAIARKQPWVRFNLTGETTVDEFVGKYTLKDGNTEWQDGILLQAMKNGHWLIVDEFNVALPEILFVLQSLMDDDKFVVVPQHDSEIVRPHENFRLFATMNPVDEYAGTKDLNKATKSRFAMIINMEYPDAKTEVEIVQKRCSLKEEDAVRMVDVAQRVRRAKDAGEVFYTCSTRDLIQWGYLLEALGVDDSFNVAILNKANGDGGRVHELYKDVMGHYARLKAEATYTPSYEWFETEFKKLETKRRNFNKRKDTLRAEIKADILSKLSEDPKEAEEKKTQIRPENIELVAEEA